MKLLATCPSRGFTWRLCHDGKMQFAAVKVLRPHGLRLFVQRKLNIVQLFNLLYVLKDFLYKGRKLNIVQLTVRSQRLFLQMKFNIIQLTVRSQRLFVQRKLNIVQLNVRS